MTSRGRDLRGRRARHTVPLSLFLQPSSSCRSSARPLARHVGTPMCLRALAAYAQFSSRPRPCRDHRPPPAPITGSRCRRYAVTNQLTAVSPRRFHGTIHGIPIGGARRYRSWYTLRRRQMVAEPTHTFINTAHLTSSFAILSTARYVMTLLPPDLPTSLTVHIFSVVLDVDLVARVLQRG
jgi:hypothetical protein